MGGWIGQAAGADIVEIEDARYFYTSSETTVDKVVEGEDKPFRHSIQEESTHVSFTHSLMSFPTFCSAGILA